MADEKLIYYTTGSKDEFRSWIPEVSIKLFDHFDLDEISVTTLTATGTKVVFIYTANTEPLSPTFTEFLYEEEQK